MAERKGFLVPWLSFREGYCSVYLWCFTRSAKLVLSLPSTGALVLVELTSESGSSFNFLPDSDREPCLCAHHRV